MTELPDPSEPTSPAGSTGYPSRRSLRAEQTAARVTTESIRLPLIKHVPAKHAPETRPVTKRRRVAGAFATASVCGLVLTLSLPVIGTTDTSEAAGGVVEAQQLFSETTLDELPATITEISAADIEVPVAATYAPSPERIVNYPFKTEVTLTDGFGYRTAPVEQFHDAQDFAAPAGTPIYAIADGVVLEAGFATDGCGFGLKLEHELDGDTVSSRYCHMEDGSHDHQVGDELKMGDQVGTVGNTGMSFGPHLHLAIRVNDEPVDPMPFFAEYTRIERDSDSADSGRSAEGISVTDSPAE